MTDINPTMKTLLSFILTLLCLPYPAILYAVDFYDQYQQLDVPGFANDITLGDINQDGLMDIAMASDGVTIYLNDIKAQYQKQQQLSLNNARVNNVLLSDLNLDGYPELIAAHNNSQIVIFWNKGNGNFIEEGYQFSAEFGTPTQLLAADINRDGATDILVNVQNIRPRMYLNNGDGTFPSTSQPLLSYAKPVSKLLLANINNDDYPDIVSFEPRNGDVRFHFGNINAEFVHQESLDIQQKSLMDISVDDVNQDGLDDLLLLGFDRTQLLINSPEGGMSSKDLDLGVSRKVISSMSMADVDTDGDTDLILSVRDQGIFSYLNNGHQDFSLSPIFPATTNQYTNLILAKDVDADKDADVVFSTRGKITIFSNNKNKPDPNFQVVSSTKLSVRKPPVTETKVFSFAPGVAINQHKGIDNFDTKDFTGDGLPDLVTLTYDHRKPVLTFYRNVDGKKLAQLSLMKGPKKAEISALAFFDVDNDNDLDLLIGWFNQYITVHTNDGSGKFSSTGKALMHSDIRTRRIIAGDINNDGNLDLVAVGKKRSQIYFNMGEGRFITDHLSGLPKEHGQDAALNDIDKDGDLDLFIASGNKILLYFNRGNGSFEKNGIRLFHSTLDVDHIFLRDLDHDSDMDILAVKGSSTFAYINEGHGNFKKPEMLKTIRKMAPVDIDGDQDTDIFIYGPDTKNAALLNDGHANWIPFNHSIINDTARMLKFTDFDADGYIDIVALNSRRNQLSLFNNLGFNKLSQNIASEEKPAQIDTNSQPLSAHNQKNQITNRTGKDTALVNPFRDAYIYIAILLSLLLIVRLWRHYR
jgi:hypothetical protein